MFYLRHVTKSAQAMWWIKLNLFTCKRHQFQKNTGGSEGREEGNKKKIAKKNAQGKKAEQNKFQQGAEKNNNSKRELCVVMDYS